MVTPACLFGSRGQAIDCKIKIPQISSLSLKLQLPQCFGGGGRKTTGRGKTHVAFQNSAVERRKGMLHIFLT
ncbi:hypothetical protein SRHO_G00185430 [Serrasalmus rhombeus]